MLIKERVEVYEPKCEYLDHWVEMIIWGHCSKCKHMISKFDEAEAMFKEHKCGYCDNVGIEERKIPEYDGGQVVSKLCKSHLYDFDNQEGLFDINKYRE